MSAGKIWIKICANTSLDDALLAGEAGADAVGFVFAPSKRRVTVEQAAGIVPQLPAALEKIGVFVDTPFEEIAAAVETCGLTGVQLHFEAPRELAALLRARFGPALRIVRTVHFDLIQTEELGARGIRPYTGDTEPAAASSLDSCLSDRNIDAILLDSRSATAAGGTGVAFDWDFAATSLFQNPRARQRRIVAAGGLTVENVAEAIGILRPWGVDVASGVESEPGRKDPVKLRAFIAAARGHAVN